MQNDDVFIVILRISTAKSRKYRKKLSKTAADPGRKLRNRKLGKIRKFWWSFFDIPKKHAPYCRVGAQQRRTWGISERVHDRSRSGSDFAYPAISTFVWVPATGRVDQLVRVATVYVLAGKTGWQEVELACEEEIFEKTKSLLAVDSTTMVAWKI